MTAPWVTPPPRRSPWDTAATVVIGVLALAAAAASVLFSTFFVMAVDACGPDNCDFSWLTWAYVVAWGGVGLSLVVAVVGMVRAAWRGTVMWVWPALATGLVLVTFVAGALLAGSVAR